MLGEHAVALAAHLAHALGVGGGQVDGGSLPPGQEGVLCALGGDPAGSQQLVQRQAAQRLQKGQLAVQRGLQGRGQCACGGTAHADGLGFQHGSTEVVAPVGGVLKQCSLKLRHGVTHGTAAGRAGGHAVRQVHELCHNGIVQQTAKDHEPVQTGIPFVRSHIPVPQLHHKNTRTRA